VVALVVVGFVVILALVTLLVARAVKLARTRATSKVKPVSIVEEMEGQHDRSPRGEPVSPPQLPSRRWW